MGGNNFIFSIAALVIVSSIIIYFYKRSKIKEYKIKISGLMDDIKTLCSKTPLSIEAELKGSAELKEMFDKLKDYAFSFPFILDKNITYQPTIKNYIELKSKHDTLKKMIEEYDEYVSMIKDKIKEILNAERLKLETYKKVDRASSAIDKLNNNGYSISLSISRADVDNVDNIIIESRNTIKTDIPKAIKLYNQYVSKLIEISEFCYVYTSKLKELENTENKI